MRLKSVSNYFYILAIMVVIPVAQAREVEWVRDQGFPYVLTYNEQNIVTKYCYGEVEHLITEKKSEILCRAMNDEKCPLVTVCYDKCAMNGVL